MSAYFTPEDHARIQVALDAIAAGPSDGDLAHAPVLSGWSMHRYGNADVWSLRGHIAAHPVLTGDGDLIATSPVLAIDPSLRWARTVSRFYRLGHVAHADSLPDGHWVPQGAQGLAVMARRMQSARGFCALDKGRLGMDAIFSQMAQ